MQLGPPNRPMQTTRQAVSLRGPLPGPSAQPPPQEPESRARVKLNHKVNFGWSPPSEQIDDAYQRELDETLRKAERAWRKAQQAAERAERAAAKQPSPEKFASRDEARRLVLQRLAELREIEELMQSSPYRQATVVHRTGKQNRLEVGVKPKPKRKRTPKASRVESRRTK